MFETIRNVIRSHPKWGFLAEMVGETHLPGMTMQVGDGTLLINAAEAIKLDPDTLVDRVRGEFRKLALERAAG